ncbi:MAG: class I adenylate-forming enzyme family protein [Actinomycetota bacterium]|nr:class I adenylate-forming enzyme family protein [Actinomycetota bacterium]
MGLSLREAISQVTAPGQLFEVTTRTVDGVTRRVFSNSPTTLRDIFDGARGVHETFLVYEGEEWSFDAVMVASDEFADSLVHRFGVGHGDRVGIAMRNLPEWIVAFSAIVSVGAIAVSLNAWWTSDELDYAICDADVQVLVADWERCEKVLETCRRRQTPIVVVRADDTNPLPAGVAHWGEVVVRGAPLPRVELSSFDDATILYTSGTTGQPKGAVSTHDAICQTLMAFSTGLIVEGQRRGPRDHPAGDPTCFILIVPLFHVTGCVPVMLSSFSWHFKLVMMHHWDPEQALGLIEKHRVTNVVGVPTQSWDLLNCPDRDRFDTSSLVTVGGGGAPAASTLVARVEESFANARPNLAFGMTETNAYGPQNYGDDYQRLPASTGQTPTVVMDVEIHDAVGQVMAPGAIGEIWVSGPTLFRGYWRQPEATADALVAGWLRTGDVGHLDEEGFLFIEDRLKDMILRGGDNVYCAEVESVLFEHPDVREAAVCGLPDERLGESVAAVVVLREGAQLDELQLASFLAGRLAPYKIPTRVVFTYDRLPANGAGKISKVDLARHYFRSNR